MKQTVYNGVTVFLVDDSPNWNKGYQSEHACVLDVQESLTKRETRRAYSETLRTIVICASTVADAALRTLLGQLRQLKAQPVVCPFWPAVAFWSTRGAMSITGGLHVVFKRDWSNFAIWAPGVDAEPGWPLPGDYVAPLMWGFFAKSAEPKVGSGSLATWSYEFDEAGPFAYSLAFASGAWDDGPKPAGYAAAPKILPFRQDYRASSDAFRFSLKRTPAGFSREQPTTAYPHDVYRGQSAQFTILGQPAISDFLAFFSQRSGQGEPFWVPSAIESARLAVPAGAGDVAVTVTGVESIQVNDYLCAVFPTGTVAWAKVNTIVGNVVTFFAPFGVALPEDAMLFALNLAEVSGSKMTVKWKSPSVAVCSFAWTEVRPETVVPAGETVGTTIGKQARRIILFHFWRDYGNGTVVHQRLTNYERDVSWGGFTWTSQPGLECDEIIKSLNLEDDSCAFSSNLVNPDGTQWATNPLLSEITLTSEVPLNVEILFGEP